ncbi:RING finger domain-containing protein [Hirsutella rhossiliensis]|uniref:RING finger domain-containing protein n=1 Tax=Hirsutella rhossiliensis TaxID=111463 RepID=A0A9P8N9D1_9HYPO|nr:RING finger domain-containing protein [Hirsutella rhossiliensis]KAH0968396.1 RING finger domain-containing protein [Hirsutella rhossiliensis]
MEGHSTPDDDGLASPTLPPAAPDAIAAPRPVDAPRRCFICLTDQDPSDPPGSWVDPCPCTLEAHQDCMLSWVTDCERSNKPLFCPVCKSKIELEGHWDLVVAAEDAIHRRFTRVSPFVLFTGVSMGVQFSLQLYGALALWTFAGKDSLLRFLLGPDLVIDASRAGSVGFVKDRIWRALAMMNVAPALLFGRLLPSLSNKVYLPAASLYGMYHIMHEDDFVSWPPSPRLAIAVFPYVRSMYYNLWREFVLPHEVKLNRQLVGLPPVEERPNAGQQMADNQDDVDQPGGHDVHHIEIVHEEGEAHGHMEGEIMVELQIGEVERDEDGIPVDQELIEMAQIVEHPEPEADAHDGPAAPVAPPNQGNNADEGGQGHEAPQAPPRRLGIGAILSNVSNAIVGALILPGISLAMGEALRLALPKAWTKASRHGTVGRPGLLQQQWGRSLIGGCLYVVLKDTVRVYTKSRRVAALGNRRVKNVDRRRRGRSDDAPTG